MPTTLLASAFLALGISACGRAIDVDSTTAPATQRKDQPQPLLTGAYHLRTHGRMIVESGRPVPIRPKSITGYIDNVIPASNLVTLSGWAARADLGRPAETVVAFVGGKAVAVLKPSGERPDLVEGYDKPGLLRSGFLLNIPIQSLDCSVPGQGLHVLGIADGEATPLVWLEDTRQRVDDECGARHDASP